MAEEHAVCLSPTVRRIVGPTILLQSGEYFDFLAPETSKWVVDDIAHGLAMTCRFAGQALSFYSVAEHSVHASRLVPEEDALAALLHDAAEAFIGDVSKPLKDLLPDYRAIETRIEAAVFDRLGIPTPLPPSVKEADLVMLATELRKLMRNRDDWDYTRGRNPANVEIKCWAPEVAKFVFLSRFYELSSATR